MFKASAVIELRFLSKGDVWSFVISFFLTVLGTCSITWELMKNINKTRQKIENVNDDGIK